MIDFSGLLFSDIVQGGRDRASTGSVRRQPCRIKQRLCALAGVLFAGLFLACTHVAISAEVLEPPPYVDVNPEAATGVGSHELVRAKHYMFSSAHPLATQVGTKVLAQGGSAIDALIAAQMVLNLVEPQSSGIGGGAFIVTYDAASGKVQAYDGRETAPAASRSDRFMREGKAIPFRDAVNSGLSVGTPGLLRMLALVHDQHGALAWSQLFGPAITLAEQGFPVSARLHALLNENEALRQQPAAAKYFYDAAGIPWPIGHILKNPSLAAVFRRVAAQGPAAFYQGDIARDIVDAVAGHAVPGDLSMDDMSAYRAQERPALCTPYKAYTLCGVPPPSSGPLAVMQILNILTHTPIAQLPPDSLEAVHYFSEAGKLAFADRDVYVADPAFIDVPVQALLDPDYLAARARLIDPSRSMGRAPPGDPVGKLPVRGQDDSPELPSTSHIVAVDARGNVASMTSSIESAFGSKIFVDGFLLNNELTDFSLSDVDASGKPVANRLEPGKRPRSSMAPMLILKDGKPFMAIGSPGGSAIINYAAKTLLGVLDWELDIQQAIDLPNRGSRNSFTELEKNTSLHPLAP
ncbi:MAG TPA: gamma-glutamyltransferase, partial [Burkholderiaceae bacterium]|nr:gamma-glutamyltransferase [Burkholderiaceae bacterium]